MGWKSQMDKKIIILHTVLMPMKGNTQKFDFLLVAVKRVLFIFLAFRDYGPLRVGT
jgi:hypothetical protein